MSKELSREDLDDFSTEEKPKKDKELDLLSWKKIYTSPHFIELEKYLKRKFDQFNKLVDLSPKNADNFRTEALHRSAKAQAYRDILRTIKQKAELYDDIIKRKNANGQEESNGS